MPNDKPPNPPDALPLDQVLHGDSIQVLADLPPRSVDLIFADPPYNLRLQSDLMRPNQTRVDAVDDAWDQFDSVGDYDAFTRDWLSACRRVLKDEGTIWVIGSYHNIFRVGSIMADLGFWTLNDVVWVKTNPMPNFRGTRFTNATETLIWAQKSQQQRRYTFNYHGMKQLNDGKQMTNVWQLPICSGAERIRVDGKKAHSTQKPEALLYRVILASSNPGDVVLDPFFGSGTTGAVARRLKRHFIGIEREAAYVAVARQRIAGIGPDSEEPAVLNTPSRRRLPRVPFGVLVGSGYLRIGQTLYSRERRHQARIHADSALVSNGNRGSIHKVASLLLDQQGANGWDFWYYEDDSGELHSIDELRQRYRAEAQEAANP